MKWNVLVLDTPSSPLSLFSLLYIYSAYNRRSIFTELIKQSQRSGSSFTEQGNSFNFFSPLAEVDFAARIEATYDAKPSCIIKVKSSRPHVPPHDTPSPIQPAVVAAAVFKPNMPVLLRDVT